MSPDSDTPKTGNVPLENSPASQQKPDKKITESAPPRSQVTVTWPVQFGGFLGSFRIKRAEHFPLGGPAKLIFLQDGAMSLSARLDSPGNAWISLVATIVTFIFVNLVAQVTGFMVGPGWLIWYFIVRSLRREDVSIELNDSEEAIVDTTNKRLGFHTLFRGKSKWVIFETAEGFDEILQRIHKINLSRTNEIKISRANLLPTLLLSLIIAGSITFSVIYAHKNPPADPLQYAAENDILLNESTPSENEPRRLVGTINAIQAAQDDALDRSIQDMQETKFHTITAFFPKDSPSIKLQIKYPISWQVREQIRPDILFKINHPEASFPVMARGVSVDDSSQEYINIWKSSLHAILDGGRVPESLYSDVLPNGSTMISAYRRNIDLQPALDLIFETTQNMAGFEVFIVKRIIFIPYKNQLVTLEASYGYDESKMPKEEIRSRFFEANKLYTLIFMTSVFLDRFE